MLTPPLTHPDSISTWPSARGKASLWIPYFERVERVGKSKKWMLYYRGGSVECSPTKCDHIMLYGATGALPTVFLDSLAVAGVVISIHRRNVPRPVLVLPYSTADADDVLSAQIARRSDLRSAAMIARTLVRERISTQSDFGRIAVSATTWKSLNQCRTIDGVRAIEANAAARYWESYFERLGASGQSRRGEGDIKAALDALSVFLSGVVLRWILFHRLAPTHAFLHTPTTYPSLVYDLIEPYRVWIEMAVADAWQAGARGEALVSAATDRLKSLLDEQVYVPTMQVFARRKALLHGVVLALRSYLVGDMKRFVVPMEGERVGGRPIKATYRLPGASPRKSARVR